MSDNEATLEQQIANAMSEGDWTKSFQLKSQLLDRNGGSSAGTTEPATATPAPALAPEDAGHTPVLEEVWREEQADLEQQIMAAQNEGDWTRSFRLKSALLDRQNRAGARERANGGWANR